MRQFTFCMEIEAGTLHGRQVSKAVFTVRPVWVTNGRRSAVIAMLDSSLRMLQFHLGMDGPFRSMKQGACPISYLTGAATVEVTVGHARTKIYFNDST